VNRSSSPRASGLDHTHAPKRGVDIQPQAAYGELTAAADEDDKLWRLHCRHSRIATLVA
jgi:hypothetical protein